MKKILLLTFLFMISCSTINYQIPIDSQSEIVKIWKYSNHLFIVEDPNYWKTNSVIYITKNYIYFFGTGWGSQSAKQILWKTKTLSFIPFKGVYVIAPQLEFINGASEFIEEDIPIYIQKEGYEFLYQNWLVMQKKYSVTFQTWEIREIPQINITIENTLYLEDSIYIFYPGKILVPGNLVIYFPKEKVLYAGNIFFSPKEFSINKNNINIQNYMNFLIKIQNLDIKNIISGKGSPIHSPKIIFELIEYLKKT